MIILELTILFIIYVASSLAFKMAKSDKSTLRNIMIIFFAEEVLMWILFLLALFFEIRIVTILKIIVPIKALVKGWLLIYSRSKK